MKRAGVIFILLFVFIAFSGPATADDMFAPEWREGQNVVFALWDGWIPHSPGPPPAYLPDIFYSNPPLPTIPIATANAAGYLPSFAGRLDVMQMYAHDGLVFEMPNYDNENPVKRIRVQVTYYDLFGDPFIPFGFNVWTDIHQGALFYPADETTLVGSYAHEDDWTTAAYEFEILPNPEWESIGLKFWHYDGGFDSFGSPDEPVPGVFIDQVVIDTQCAAVPVPAAVWLLGTGLLCLIGARRNRMQ